MKRGSCLGRMYHAISTQDYCREKNKLSFQSFLIQWKKYGGNRKKTKKLCASTEGVGKTKKLCASGEGCY